MLTFVPLVTVHTPPLSTASVMVAVIASQSLGLLTVMLPVSCQPLLMPPSCVTEIVYLNVAVAPLLIVTDV